MRIILSLLLLELCMCCHAQINQELLFPHANHVSNASLVNFQWNRNPNIPNQYRFQLSLDSNFVNILIDDTTAAGTYSVGPLGPTNTCYYWRVRSLNPASSWSWVRKYYFFNPNNLNGLVAWLAPSNGLNLAGNSIIGMTDQGVFNNNAFQSTAAQRPTFIPSDSIINNQASVKYDGSNDFLEMSDSPSLDFTTEFTAHALVKPSVIAVNKTILAKWDYQTQGSWVWQTEFSTADEYMFSPCFTVTDPGNQKVITTNADMVVNKPTLMTLTYNANTQARATYHKNFQVLNTSTVGTIPQYLPNSTATLKVGKYGGTATRYYQGDITEVLLFNNAQNDSLRNLVDAYLRFKYCPPVNLGPDTLISSTLNCGNIQLKPSYRFTSYLWSTGSTASRIFVQQPGKYWVTVTDFMGVVSKDTIEVKPPYSFNKPASNVLCQGQSMTWTTNFPTNSFSFLWQNGSTSPSMTITQPGPYFVKVTDNNGCFVRSDTLIVTLDTYPTTAFLGADTSLCIGNVVSLQQGAQQTTSYAWNNGTTGSTFPITNGGMAVISLTSTNVNGCVAQDTMQITVAGFAPQLNYSISASGCTNAPIWFANNSTVPPPSLLEGIQWSFDNGQTFSSNNGQFQPNAVGWIYGEIEAIATGNCISRDTFSTFIFAPPNVQISNTGFCENENIAFVATDSNGVALTDFSWNFGQPSAPNNLDTLENPIHLYQSSGNYNITLTATDANGCLDTANHSLSLLTAPTSQFSVTQFCEQTNIPYNNTSFSNDTSLIVQFHWEFGDGNTDSLINPTHLYAQEGVYSNQLIAVSSNGCSDTISQTIQIQPSPVLSWNLSPSCKNLPTVFESTSTIPSGSIDSTQWLVNLQFPIEETQGAYTFLTNGIQYLNLTAISDLGCSADTLILVNVNPGLSTAFTVHPQVCLAGSEATFTPTGFGYNSLQWQIGSEAIDTLNAIQYLVPDSLQNDTLEVLCIGSNAVGCVDTTIVTLPILGRVLELGISQLYLSEINGQSFVGVTLENQGTILIDSCTLRLSLSNNVLFENLCTQVILPGQNYIYVFPSSPMLGSLGQNEISDLLCVNAVVETFENIKEESLLNNQGCLLLEGQLFDLTNPSPNPAAESTMVQLIVSEPMTITMDSYNLQGQKIATILDHVMLEEGTYSIEIDLAKYAKGNYYLEVGNGTTSIKKSLLRW